MSIHEIVLTLLSTLNPPDDVQPKIKPIPDHYFCCSSVDNAGKGSGEGCVNMTSDHVNTCSDVLFCPGGWTKSDGTVHCTAATRREAPPPTEFCCDSTGTDEDGRRVGDGCGLSIESVCTASALVCSDSWTMSERSVTCL